MLSEVLPARPTTIIESNKNADLYPINSPSAIAAQQQLPALLAPSAPIVTKSNGIDAIFNIVPINTDHYGPYGKPNAIVRPVRRNEPNEMTLPQANEPNLPASNQSTPKVNVPLKHKKQEIDTFTKELENKLKHLQRDKKSAVGNVKIITKL